MKTSSKIISLAEKECQEKGEKLTKKRKTILLALLESKKAISAYELADYCKQHFNEIIPVMSIYRILDFLQTQGLAHRLDLANKYVACSHIACGHKHKLSQFLICDQCQCVEEINIDSSALKNLQALIDKTGFHLNKPQLELNGTCKQCFLIQTNTG
ncbi:MAG: Fur family transcriptional regulator [Cellvibrionaceae bacterium]